MMVPAVRTHAQILLKVNREDDFFAVCALQEAFWFVQRLVAQGCQDTANAPSTVRQKFERTKPSFL